jgi:hypothetical protein
VPDARTFPSGSSSTKPTHRRQIGLDTFIWLVVLLAGAGVVRSAIATRLDGFTIDEAYHIAAGVSYVRYGDFRINPEHPPLVKLWVGSVIAATGFQLDPLRQFTDKPDERKFTQTSVFQKNDPDSVQRRARAAMFVLNGLLLRDTITPASTQATTSPLSRLHNPSTATAGAASLSAMPIAGSESWGI